MDYLMIYNLFWFLTFWQPTKIGIKIGRISFKSLSESTIVLNLNAKNVDIMIDFWKLYRLRWEKDWKHAIKSKRKRKHENHKLGKKLLVQNIKLWKNLKLHFYSIVGKSPLSILVDFFHYFNWKKLLNLPWHFWLVFW